MDPPERTEWNRLIARGLVQGWFRRLHLGLLASAVSLIVGYALSELPLRHLPCAFHVARFFFYLLGACWVLVVGSGSLIALRVRAQIAGLGLFGPDVLPAKLLDVRSGSLVIRTAHGDFEVLSPSEGAGDTAPAVPLVPGDDLCVVGLSHMEASEPYRRRPMATPRHVIPGSPAEIVHRALEGPASWLDGVVLVLNVVSMLLLCVLGPTLACVLFVGPTEYPKP